MAAFRLLLICCLWGVSFVWAHPHVFVDAKVKVVFDNVGFAAVNNQWVFDELYSAAMMSSWDDNSDGVISSAESSRLCHEILDPLKSSNYYNYVLLETKFLKIEQLSNCGVAFKNNRLVLNFDIKFLKPATTDYTMLVVAIADPTNYIQITADMENADVDGPESIDVEYFNDGLAGLTLFRAFRSDIEGLYLRYKKK